MIDGNGHKKDNLPIVMAGAGSGVITPEPQLHINSPIPLAILLFSISQVFDVEGVDHNSNSVGTISELTP
ncbi:hypothetical protein [Rubinisphaera italica]|nr:hypothetical protein [Rubinisphaera italica]